ncbi:hypothetical protein [Thalassorhabdomicrobium marinisediminis]|uniref:hypothetical protein n=1 Tax=Thalassorhabdomicrobium marinisediminis TaxID=2170577 RepID=UPI00249144A1|nr:hypothetical protein [Thalassorhabdomicrobium marinisediminis]
MNLIQYLTPEGSRAVALREGTDVIAGRLAKWTPPDPAMTSGYQKLYVDTVLQADEGADLSFLVGSRGHKTPRASH